MRPITPRTPTSSSHTRSIPSRSTGHPNTSSRMSPTPITSATTRPAPPPRSGRSKKSAASGLECLRKRWTTPLPSRCGSQRRRTDHITPSGVETRRVVNAGWSDGEQVACAGIAARVAELAHRPGLDLADPLACEVEVLADLFECARLAAVESEAELEDLALALVERRQQA